MKNIYFILIISFLIPSDIITINGKIKNSNGKILEGVNIYTNRNGVSTDKSGSFTLTCFSNEIVTISHISYSTITIEANQMPNTIILKSRNINSDDIIIRGGMIEKSIKETNNNLTILQS